MTIKLHKFSNNDIHQLISLIPDERFLLQWAGPDYKSPLTPFQLQETLNRTEGKSPTVKVYKAVHKKTSKTTGHIQLVNIDYHASICTLGRVFIYPDHRGKNFGVEMVNLSLFEAFKIIGLHEVTLNVFDFNVQAIAIYKKAGFIEYDFKHAARQFQDEFWNVIKMKISKNTWNNRNDATI